MTDTILYARRPASQHGYALALQSSGWVVEEHSEGRRPKRYPIPREQAEAILRLPAEAALTMMRNHYHLSRKNLRCRLTGVEDCAQKDEVPTIEATQEQP